MEFVLLVGVMFVAVVVIAVSFVMSQKPGGSDEKPRLVTESLDYSILGQRPEIVTEEDSESAR